MPWIYIALVQIIATSRTDLGLQNVAEASRNPRLFQGNLGLWNIMYNLARCTLILMILHISCIISGAREMDVVKNRPFLIRRIQKPRLFFPKAWHEQGLDLFPHSFHLSSKFWLCMIVYRQVYDVKQFLDTFGSQNLTDHFGYFDLKIRTFTE